MNEQVKRYDYGYKDDGCGGDRYLGLIEKPDGALVSHSDYAALEAECERLRAQVSALQSEANSWQSGYDKGREDGAKHRQSEVDQLRAEVEASRLLLEQCNEVIAEDGGVYIELRAFLAGTMPASDVIALLRDPAMAAKEE